MSTQQISPSKESLFRGLDEYPWSSDHEYQRGLQSILRSGQSSKQARILELKARCFYFSRKYHMNVDAQAYDQWQSSKSHGPENGHDLHDKAIICEPSESMSEGSRPVAPETIREAATVEQAPQSVSFSHIADLIMKGEQVPNVREIPDTVLYGQESSSSATSRKKPWEK